LADGEFNNLSSEVDRYVEEVSLKTEQGNLDIELNTISLYEYLYNLKKRIKFDIELMESKGALATTVGALYLYGIRTIAELDKLFSDEFLSKIHEYKHFKYLSLPYLATEALMYADIDGYFQRAHVRNNIAIDSETADVLIEKYGSEKVNQLLETHNLSIIDLGTKGFTFGPLKGLRLGTSTNKT
jgi:hypothetical protein